jgi:hypothetical protein
VRATSTPIAIDAYSKRFVPAPENWLKGTAASSPRPVLTRSAFDASIALAAFAASESVVNPVAFGLSPVPIAALLGAFLGSAMGLAYIALSRLPRPRRLLAWCAAGGALGVLPAVAIGSLAKLHGPHATMALATLATTPVAGAGVGALLALGQPGRSDAAPVMRAPWLVVSLLAALVSGFAVEVCDETLLVLRGYPAVRTAVFGSACLLCTQAGIAVGAWLRPLPDRRVARAVMAVWAAVVLSGIAGDAAVSEDRIDALMSRPLAGRFFRLARATTDVDGDGSSSLFGGADCAPFDARVNPRARELPGNGVDDNCRWGDAKAKLRRAPTEHAAALAPPPVDVVLVTVDTLRADHLGSYGYSRPTTPRMDEFGKTALRFEHAYTSGGWTCLAINSMLTGLYPRELDWKPVAITNEQRMVLPPLRGRLRAGERSLAMLSEPTKTPVAPLPLWLRARGVRTAAVVASKPGTLLDYDRFLERAFDRTTVTPKGSDDSAVVDAALTTLSSFGTSPFFLWVHLFEPHEPYAHHPEVPAFGEELVDLYDHDVAFCDYQIGRLLAAIEARRGRPTAVILTADHGEAFLGGLPVHGEDLHEESIRIPLFVRGPGVRPGVSGAYVSLVDVAPTILEWTATPGGDLDGTSLLHPLANRAVLTDIWRHDDDAKVIIDLVGVTSGNERLVRDRLNETWTMYAAHAMARPLRPSGEPVDERLRAVIGHYLEGAGMLE